MVWCADCKWGMWRMDMKKEIKALHNQRGVDFRALQLARKPTQEFQEKVLRVCQARLREIKEKVNDED